MTATAWVAAHQGGWDELLFVLVPIGLLPSERQTTAKCPSYQSHVSFEVIFPPGPIGLAIISPSLVQVPTK